MRVLFERRLVHFALIVIVSVACLVYGWRIGEGAATTPLGVKPALWDLFWNNVKVGFFIFLAGLITMGIGALFLIGFNMMILGVASGSVYASSGFRPIVTGVLPHAPFEIGAMVLCGLLGFEGWRVLAVCRERLVSGLPVSFNFKGSVMLAFFGVLLYGLGAAVEALISYV